MHRQRNDVMFGAELALADKERLFFTHAGGKAVGSLHVKYRVHAHLAAPGQPVGGRLSQATIAGVEVQAIARR